MIFYDQKKIVFQPLVSSDLKHKKFIYKKKQFIKSSLLFNGIG